MATLVRRTYDVAFSTVKSPFINWQTHPDVLRRTYVSADDPHTAAGVAALSRTI